MMERKTLRIVVYSDLQAHHWQEHEREDRLGDCIKAIGLVHEVAQDVSADMLVFNGDLFEAKRSVRADVASRVYEKLISYGDTEYAQVFNAGNHDYSNDSCSLNPLRSIGTVVGNPKRSLMYHVKDWNLLFIPNGYPYHTSEFKPESVFYHLCFVHGNVQGANMTRAVRCTHDDYPHALFKQTKERMAVINGHFHTPDTLVASHRVPIYICGAPLAHNWNDVGSFNRGCMILTLSSADGLHVERCNFYQHFPVFLAPDQAHLGRCKPGSFGVPLDFLQKDSVLSPVLATGRAVNALQRPTRDLNAVVAAHIRATNLIPTGAKQRVLRKALRTLTNGGS
jgi:DNA repair exonuclease SbcCD nuclease subunit